MKRLLTLVAVLLFMGTAVFSQSQHCIDGWNYAKEITISNSSSSDINDTQIKLVINTQDINGLMNVNGTDIRFISECCTELPYVIEKGLNTPNTEFLVRIPQIPANGSKTITMIYGNSNALTNTQNPDLVFDLYEDFTLGQTSSVHFNQVCSYNFSSSFTSNGLNMSWNSSGYGSFVSYKKLPKTNDYYVRTELHSVSGQYFYAGLRNTEVNTHHVSYLISDYILTPSNYANNSIVNCYSAYLNPSGTLSSLSGTFTSLWKTTGANQSIATGPGAYKDYYLSVEIKSDSQRVSFGAVEHGTGSATLKNIKVHKYYDTTAVTSIIGSQISIDNTYLSIHSGNDTITTCNGYPVTLSAENVANFSNIAWNTGETTDNISVNSTGNYTIEGYDIFGCVSSATFTVINELNNGSIIYTQVNDSTFSFSIDNAPNATITWDLGDGTTAIGEVVSNSYPIGLHHICANIITEYEACNYDICTTITVADHTGTEELNSLYINIYPNPSTTYLNIEVVEKSILTLYNLVGQKVLERSELDKGLNTISIENLPSGNYVIEIKSNSSTSRSTIIKL